MSLTKNKKTAVFSSLGVMLILILGFSAFSVFKSNNEYEKLRNKYPLITQSQYLIEDPRLGFEERVAAAPNIAKIKVVKRLPDYTVTVDDKAVGLSSVAEFCQYRVKLVEDITKTNIATDKNGTFIITFAKNLDRSYPDLDKDVSAVCSLEPASGVHEGKYIFYDRTFYYLDGGTALAAYEGDDSCAKKSCKEEKLIEQIKRIRENETK